MAQHKWHKEIKAWADGVEIEIRTPLSKYIALHSWNKFQGNTFPMVEFEDGIPMDVEYRIKPQPKEPQYLYVYQEYGMPFVRVDKIESPDNGIVFIGKIKLEVDDEPTNSN